jgi:DNA-binding LytR/AlgR family response regulator
VKIAIAEDERVIARRLARGVRDALGAKCEQLTICSSLEECRDHLADNQVDLLLLDLNLHGADGFDLLSEAAAESSHTIVVSANTDRALEAFDYGVLDFVPKPFTQERLEQALDRALRPTQKPQHRAVHLAVRTVRGLELLPVKGVRAIHGAGNYAEVEMLDGKRKLHYKSLDRLEQLLPSQFMRIHRSHIVNLGCVNTLRNLPGSRYQLLLDDDTVLPVSRARVAELRVRLI